MVGLRRETWEMPALISSASENWPLMTILMNLPEWKDLIKTFLEMP